MGDNSAKRSLRDARMGVEGRDVLAESDPGGTLASGGEAVNI